MIGFYIKYFTELKWVNVFRANVSVYFNACQYCSSNGGE